MVLFAKNRAIEVIAPFSATGLTVSVVYYDEARNASTGTATEIGITANYYYSFTPDAEGDWRVVLFSGAEKHIFHFPVYGASDTYLGTIFATGATEKTVFEVAKVGIYRLSAYMDIYDFEHYGEGGTITFRLYNKIDGTNYRVISKYVYTVGASTEHPIFEINAIHNYCKVTIQCTTATTRAIPYRYIVEDLEK